VRLNGVDQEPPASHTRFGDVSIDDAILPSNA
jgi:hypothetical protein